MSINVWYKKKYIYLWRLKNLIQVRKGGRKKRKEKERKEFRVFSCFERKKEKKEIHLVKINFGISRGCFLTLPIPGSFFSFLFSLSFPAPLNN